MLIHLVVHDLNPQAFIKGGQAGVDLIKKILNQHNIQLNEIKNVLDFGVGCGRIFRWWKDMHMPEEMSFWGTDINPALIEWCKINMDFGHFSVNALHPPIHFQDSQFDLIYAFSVFTHLMSETQAEWLSEFSRILAPNKYLLVSVHGHFFAKNLPPVMYEVYKKTGYCILSKNVEGENVCTSYQDQAYSENLFANFFEVLDYFPSALTACGNQDLYLLRNGKSG